MGHIIHGAMSYGQKSLAGVAVPPALVRLDDVECNLRILGIHGWRRKTKNKEKRKNIRYLERSDQRLQQPVEPMITRD